MMMNTTMTNAGTTKITEETITASKIRLLRRYELEEAKRLEEMKQREAARKAQDERYLAMVAALHAEQRANAHKPFCGYRHCVQKVETEGEFCGDLCRGTAIEYHRIMKMSADQYEADCERRDAEFQRQGDDESDSESEYEEPDDYDY
jgi:hypothetical protein